MNGRMENYFLQEKAINKSRRNDGIRVVVIIDLGKNQESLTLVGRSFFGKHNIYIVSNYLPTEQLSTTKGENWQLYRREMVSMLLGQRDQSRLHWYWDDLLSCLPDNRQYNKYKSIYATVQYVRRISSLLCTYCQKWMVWVKL